VGIFLGGGLARIERQQSPLQDKRFQRLEPGRMAFLSPGDKLVVIRGYELRVENDEDIVVAIAVSRLSHDWDPAMTTADHLGQPR
ncbi:MAG: hypothetical protein ACRDJC_10660, partial [Thermomicrobiales bacterium]